MDAIAKPKRTYNKRRNYITLTLADIRKMQKRAKIRSMSQYGRIIPSSVIVAQLEPVGADAPRGLKIVNWESL